MGKVIGITGGIASGKSTVVSYLRKQGYPVIDADQLVHDLQEPGGRLYQALLAEFGTAILQEDGRLNRQRLAEMIFSDKEALQRSGRLQNEIIREELANLYHHYRQQYALFFMDIPLLLELGYGDWFDEIWLVYVSEEVQLHRLVMRNHYTLDEAKKRMDSQLSLEKKRELVNCIIDNNQTFEETQKQIDEQLKRLL